MSVGQNNMNLTNDIDAPNMKKLLDAIKASSDDLSAQITGLKVTIDTIQSSVNTNTTKIKDLEESLEKHKSTCDNDRQQLRKMVRTGEQKRLENNIVLKGFPSSKFDVNEVKQNLAAICGLENGYNNYYKFSRNVGKDKETNEPIWIHHMTLSFISLMDKSKVFKTIKEKGNLLLSDLLSQCDDKEKGVHIWVENALTIENLQMRKRLLELKREGKIAGFMMRSGLYVIQHKTADGQQETYNVYEMSQLNQRYPMPRVGDNNNKRVRKSDSQSPSIPPAGKQQKKFVSKQTPSGTMKTLTPH
jgi:regulator of replication initiation timing